MPKIAEWEQIVFAKLQHYVEFTARRAMTVDDRVMRELDARMWTRYWKRDDGLLTQKTMGKDRWVIKFPPPIFFWRQRYPRFLSSSLFL